MTEFFNGVDLFKSYFIVAPLLVVTYFISIWIKGRFSSTRLLRFVGMLFIGMLTSLITTGPFFFFAIPAVVLSALLVSIFLDEGKVLDKVE